MVIAYQIIMVEPLKIESEWQLMCMTHLDIFKMHLTFDIACNFVLHSSFTMFLNNTIFNSYLRVHISLPVIIFLKCLQCSNYVQTAFATPNLEKNQNRRSTNIKQYGKELLNTAVEQQNVVNNSVFKQQSLCIRFNTDKAIQVVGFEIPNKQITANKL